MKKLIALSLLAIMGLSCEQYQEEYLYNEYDKDWDLVLALAAKQCKEDSKIFSELTKRGSFSTYYDNNTYYKITVKDDDGSDYIFVKITSVTSSGMVINYYNNNTGDKLSFNYSTSENDTLITALSNGICDSRDDNVWKPSSLDSSSSVSFTDSNRNGTDDAYTDTSIKYTATVSYPLPFVQWNKAVTTTVKASGDDALPSETVNYTIEKYSQSECQSNSKCVSAENDSWNFTSANFTINTSANDDTTGTDDFISF